eukprot:UN30122
MCHSSILIILLNARMDFNADNRLLKQNRPHGIIITCRPFLYGSSYNFFSLSTSPSCEPLLQPGYFSYTQLSLFSSVIKLKFPGFIRNSSSLSYNLSF